MHYHITDKGHQWLDVIEKISEKAVEVLEAASDDEISAKELADRLGMDKKDADRIIELLEERGLIEEA